MDQDIAMKYNRRTFPIYKALAWDALFYYAIIFLFLTEVKGISASTIMYAEAGYTVFLMIFQIPATILIERVGNRKALIIGNSLVTLQIAMMIFANSFTYLLIAYFIRAFGYALKGISQYSLLYDSVKLKEGKNSFANIDAKGSSLSYFIDGITSFFTGYLFVINTYLPIILSSIVSFITVIISYRFEEVKRKEEKTKISDSIKSMKLGFRYIFNSRRLKALFLFIAIFSGTLTMISTYEKSLLRDIQIAPQYFGIIFAVLTIVSALSAKYQDKIHNAFKNKTLTFLSIPVFVSFIVVGIIGIIKWNQTMTIIIVLLGFSVQHFIRAPYWTLNKKYLTNFTNSGIRTKILSASDFIESITTSVIIFLSGLLLDYCNTSIAYLIVGIVGLGIITAVLKYMRPRFGLQPEKYRKEEIEYVEVK